MPYRSTPLANEEIYHVFNRSIAKQPIFTSPSYYQRALETINFYRYPDFGIRFSYYNNLSTENKKNFIETHIEHTNPSIEIFALCLMPNHVHFLLKQKAEKAISRFMKNFQLSYSKFYNLKNNRTGSLFQSMFKAVRIKSDEQFLHVLRYILLNPVSSFIIKAEALENYPWSSFKEYFLPIDQKRMINTEFALQFFKSQEEFREFVLNQADYQQQLEKIKHLILEDPDM